MAATTPAPAMLPEMIAKLVRLWDGAVERFDEGGVHLFEREFSVGLRLADHQAEGGRGDEPEGRDPDAPPHEGTVAGLGEREGDVIVANRLAPVGDHLDGLRVVAGAARFDYVPSGWTSTFSVLAAMPLMRTVLSGVRFFSAIMVGNGFMSSVMTARGWPGRRVRPTAGPP